MSRLPFDTTAFFRPRHSFHRLRSFHLSPASFQTKSQRSCTSLHSPQQDARTCITPANFSRPFPSSKALVVLGLFVSLVFISSISLAFLGSRREEPHFREVLNQLATESPGFVLFGENVDVDIDEPSVTIRWSVIACGQDFFLPSSVGAHGSELCGLPNSHLHIYVDSNTEPTASYDPSVIPFDRLTGERRSIQNLVQFDSDHVLDVHEAEFYPFDTYFLASTIRLTNFRNVSAPLRKIITIDTVSSFNILIQDVDSVIQIPLNGTTKLPSRDFDMTIRRPGSARSITLLLFTISWMLTHITIGHVLLAKRLTGVKPLIKHLISAGAIVLSIPQLRNSMPDAPGFDGVLIDTIGYFPQMVLSSISVVVLLLMLVAREIDIIQGASTTCPASLSTSRSIARSRPPSSPNTKSTSTEIAQYEMYRLSKHLKGEYVFPPVQPLDVEKEDRRTEVHQRRRTISGIPRAREENSVV
ncbi:hypothetical protein BDN72DRAFT_774324 [Pluteus cervinus]|uniref:Uncharacterized protein n=1 Tax=Pluteus cervinus TaxID=181527 RepID=A0ACD3AIE0_9AGAR|nr:hypothetical protein BDN72DRAFT_774324 [Pluteus cervinus]